MRRYVYALNDTKDQGGIKGHFLLYNIILARSRRRKWNHIPEISRFYGIIIRMYFGDHNPPHFHVEFQGEKATFTFDGRLRSGNISSGTARKLVRDWARRHRLELMINWKNIEEGRRLNRIKPLE